MFKWLSGRSFGVVCTVGRSEASEAKRRKAVEEGTYIDYIVALNAVSEGTI